MTGSSSDTTNTAGQSSSKLNVQLLMKIQGDRAKFWWVASIWLQVGIIGLSAYTTLTNNFATEIALLIVPVVSIATTLVRWRADVLKGAYQSLLRKFEFYDGLGWAILPREKSEWLLTLSKKEKEQVTAADRMPIHYFASNKPQSAERLLENLEESSWWSKHIAKFSAIIYGTFTALVVVGSLAVLLFSVQAAVGQASLVNIAKVIVSVIAALFSIGFVRLTVEYVQYSQSSAKFEEKACQILDARSIPDQSEATKLLHEYQIVRAGAPMLPNWAWKINEKRLNPIWAEQRLRS